MAILPFYASSSYDRRHPGGSDPRSEAPQHAAIVDDCLCVLGHVQMAQSLTAGSPPLPDNAVQAQRRRLTNGSNAIDDKGVAHPIGR
jgi:hypothetical protein